MRPITGNEIRFVGGEIQFHGAARRMLERLARKRTRQKGRTVSARQVAEGLVLGVQQGVEIQATLVRAVNRLRRILEKEVKPQ